MKMATWFVPFLLDTYWAYSFSQYLGNRYYCSGLASDNPVTNWTKIYLDKWKLYNQQPIVPVVLFGLKILWTAKVDQLQLATGVWAEWTEFGAQIEYVWVFFEML